MSAIAFANRRHCVLIYVVASAAFWVSLALVVGSYLNHPASWREPLQFKTLGTYPATAPSADWRYGEGFPWRPPSNTTPTAAKAIRLFVMFATAGMILWSLFVNAFINRIEKTASSGLMGGVSLRIGLAERGICYPQMALLAGVFFGLFVLVV